MKETLMTRLCALGMSALFARYAIGNIHIVPQRV